MNWTDEELDNLVREAAASNQVEYKDVYWQEMEAMLGNKSTSKVGMWWWMSGILLLIGISTVFVGSLNDGFGMNNQSTANLAMNESESTRDEILVNNSNLSSEINENYAVLNEGESSDDRQELSTSFKMITYDKSALQSNKKIVSQSKYQQKVNQSSKSFRGADLTEKTAGSHEGSSNSMGPIAIEGEEKDIEIVKNQSMQQKNEDALTENNALEISELAVVDWKHNLNRSPLMPIGELPILINKRIGFYVGLNGGVGQSYSMTAKNNEIYQFGVNGGLEFYRKNWAFGTGLGIRQQFTQNLTLVNSRRYYSFGMVNVNQNMTYDRLLFADFNLTASYRFGRSEFGFVATPTYLLGARMSATQSTEEIIGSQTTMNYESKATKQYVSSDNFKTFGLSLGLNYSYILVRNISIQAGVNARVIQPLLNTRFDGEQRKMPIMVELGLKKRF